MEKTKSGDISHLSSPAFVNSTSDAVITKDLNDVITSWDANAEKLFGYSHAEVSGKNISLIIPTEKLAEEQQITKLIKSGISINSYYTERIDKSGKRLHIILSLLPVLNTEGEIAGISEVLQDITWKRVLEDKQGMLAAIVDSSDDAIISKTLDGFITSWNRGAESIFGYTEDEIVNKSITVLIPPSRLAEELMILERIKAGEKVEHFETIRLKKDGTELMVSLTVSPIKNVKGEIIGASKIARDISQQYSSDIKQAILASIVDSSDDAIISKGLDGVITSWNKGAEKIFGYAEWEIIGKHISTIIPESRRGEEEIIINKIKAGEKLDHFETRRLRKDGTELILSLTISPIKNHRGEIIGCSKIARNITEQRILEHKQGTLAAIVDSSDDAIISKNLDGIITSWNKGAERIFGYNESEAIGQPITMLIPEALLDEEKVIIGKIRKGERVNHFKTTRITKDKREIELSLTVSPVKDKKGVIVGASKIARDITEQNEILRQLKRSTEQLEKLNNYKDEFIGIASHELKTPLTSIYANLQLLDRKLSDLQHKSFVEKTLKHATKLNSLVADLLDISKIQAGKLQLNTRPFNMAELVEETVESVQPTSKTHTITIQSKTETVITADRQRIEQVLINLLTNAIKYSPQANEVLVNMHASDEGVTVSIQDFGLGIPEDQMGQIFSRFFRSNDLPSSISGLGIGLYISHEIVLRHKGKMWVESQTGKGSTFYFTLPVNIHPKAGKKN